jgi:putative transposase
MTETSWKSSAHSRWECESHVVFIPKYRRKTLYGESRPSVGGIFQELARQKECRIVEGHLLADHVHMCLDTTWRDSSARLWNAVEKLTFA